MKQRLNKHRNISILSKNKIKTLIKTALETQNVPGDMAELGVYNGGSAYIISENISQKTLHLFDTFAGIPEDDSCVGGHKKGDFSSKLYLVEEYLQGKNVKFHAGFFPETTKEINTDIQFSFVHVDADIYQSTISAIDYFYPRLAVGGMILFDDYEWQKCPGVKKALLERFSPQMIKPCGEHQCVVKKSEAVWNFGKISEMVNKEVKV